MVSSFCPIQAAPRNTMLAGNQPRRLDLQHLQKPRPARGGNLQPFAFSRHYQTVVLQGLGEGDPEVTGQMIVAGAGTPKRFGRRRTSAGALRRYSQQRQPFKCGSDVRAGQPVIAVAPLAFHRQQPTLGQPRQLGAGAGQ